MVLYHYTDAKGYNGITNTNVLMPSTDSMIDATHGRGYYFTDLSPDKCDRQIAKCCWGNKLFTDRVQYFLTCDIPQGVYQWCKPNVYLVPEGRASNFNLIRKGPKPYCSLKPCNACSLDPV